MFGGEHFKYGILGHRNQEYHRRKPKETSPANPARARGQDNDVYDEMDREMWGRSRIADKGVFSFGYGSFYRLDAYQPHPRPRRLSPRGFHCRDGGD